MDTTSGGMFSAKAQVATKRAAAEAFRTAKAQESARKPLVAYRKGVA